MRLSDFIQSKEQVLDRAFSHPAMKVRPRAANPFPDMDTALKATVNAIEDLVITSVMDGMSPVMEDLLLGQQLLNGEHEEADDPDAWEAALDDEVEKAIESFVPILSNDWLGNHTISVGLHLPDGIKKFTMSMGREVYKQLTYEKSPSQIMSAAGVVSKDVEARLSIHNQQDETEMSEDNSEVEAVVAKMADYLGKDFDIMTVYEDLDLASDDDENLALGAAPRLGIDETDVEWLQMFRLEHGDDTPDKLVEMLQASFKGASKKPVSKKATAAKKPVAKKATKAAKAEVDDAAEAEGSVSSAVLGKVKESCTLKDADLALSMGVARATFNNYVNGKTTADLSADQIMAIRGFVVERLNSLHEVLAVLDNSEAEVVI